MASLIGRTCARAAISGENILFKEFPFYSILYSVTVFSCWPFHCFLLDSKTQCLTFYLVSTIYLCMMLLDNKARAKANG